MVEVVCLRMNCGGLKRQRTTAVTINMTVVVIKSDYLLETPIESDTTRSGENVLGAVPFALMSFGRPTDNQQATWETRESSEAIRQIRQNFVRCWRKDMVRSHGRP